MSKTINTRFLLRYDTWENWNSEQGKAVELLQGEIAIAAIGGTETSGSNQATTAPTILFKVGPGKFGELKWVSALAADVYAWAKEPTRPEYVATDIDYSKTITIKDDEGNVTETKTETITTQEALDALYAAIDTLSGDAGESIADLLTKLGQVEEKVNQVYVKPDDGIALTDLAASIQTSLKNADTALQAADISDLISKTDAAITINTEATNAYAAAYVIKQGETTVGTINIPKDLVVSSGSVKTKEDGSTVIELILANDAATKIEIPVDQLIEYVTTGSEDDDDVIIDVDPTTHEVTATLNNALLTKINNAMDSTAVDTKINELDSTVEVSDTDADGRVSVLTKVVQTDGKLTDKEEVKLSKIATTGNINDLEQTDGDYVIFYGGNSFGWTDPPVIE